MKIKIEATKRFVKELKELRKKHKSIDDDVNKLSQALIIDPTLGDEVKSGLARNPRKVRMAITSQGKGKSGGGRVLYFYDCCILRDKNTIYLMHIYVKSEFDGVDLNVIQKETLDILDLP